MGWECLTSDNKVVLRNQSCSQRTTSNSVISDIFLPVQQVQSILEALKPEKATGPDEIPARLLKETASIIAPSLTVLSNTSLREGKLANTVPVHKKNKKGIRRKLPPFPFTRVSFQKLWKEKELKSIIYASTSNKQLWEFAVLCLRGVSGWWAKFQWNLKQKPRKCCRRKWKHSVLSPEMFFTFLY